jgi:hypothetical protein
MIFVYTVVIGLQIDSQADIIRELDYFPDFPTFFLRNRITFRGFK